MTSTLFDETRREWALQDGDLLYILGLDEDGALQHRYSGPESGPGPREDAMLSVRIDCGLVGAKGQREGLAGREDGGLGRTVGRDAESGVVRARGQDLHDRVVSRGVCMTSSRHGSIRRAAPRDDADSLSLLREWKDAQAGRLAEEGIALQALDVREMEEVPATDYRRLSIIWRAAGDRA
jgi:hypothetical protein